MRDDRVYLLCIRDSIDDIREYTMAGRESFLGDRKTQDAVLRNLQIIGAALKRLSPEFKGAVPELQWEQWEGMSDLITHDNFGFKPDLVWQVVTKDLPPLSRTIDKHLKR